MAVRPRECQKSKKNRPSRRVCAKAIAWVPGSAPRGALD